MDHQRPLLIDEDLLPPKLAAIILGGSIKPLSQNTLALWRRTGNGPSFLRIGNSIRYRYGDLMAFIEFSQDC